MVAVDVVVRTAAVIDPSPDIRRESRFFPTPPAFNAPVMGLRRNIVMTFDTEN